MSRERASSTRVLRRAQTARRHLEQELQLVQDLALTITRAPDATAAMNQTLERLCTATGWDYGEAWLPDASGERLVNTPAWHVRSPELDGFQATSDHASFAPGEGLGGRAWRSAEPEWLEDFSDPTLFQRAEAARRAGLRRAVAVPIVTTGQVVAVLMFLMRRRRRRDRRFVELISAALSPLGPVIEGKRTEEEMARLNAELERRVAARTAELEAANRELRRGLVERTRTAETARESAERLRAVLENAAEGIITIDETGAIESFNRAAERIFGYTAQEVLGRNVSVLMPSPDRERHDGYLRRYVRTGDRHIIGIGREVLGRRKDGAVFPMDLAVGEFWGGERRYFTGICRDVTRRKQAQEREREHRAQLAYAARIATMGEMATTLAHELNQPLNAIAAYAHAGLRMLESGTNDLHKLDYALRQSALQAQRAGEVIRRIRQFVRREEDDHGDTEVNALITEVVELLQPEIRATQASVQTLFAVGLPRVKADGLEVEQVVLNLVRNAIEAVTDRPSREIGILTAMDEEGLVRVTVRDSGPGLEADAIERVFEPFYTSKIRSMGMGLSISRSIVESHQGRLWVESEPGLGSSFHFTLPPVAPA